MEMKKNLCKYNKSKKFAALVNQLTYIPSIDMEALKYLAAIDLEFILLHLEPLMKDIRSILEILLTYLKSM
jgi:hypothetical protein